MAAPISPETKSRTPATPPPSFEEVEAMLHELMKFDKRCIRNIPIAALQMAVDAVLQRGLPVERTKLLIDMYCNKVADGRLDYTELFNKYKTAVEAAEYDQGATMDEVASEYQEEDAGAVVQRLFKSWAMGRLDAQVFINKLNELEAIQSIGGVSPSCRRKIEEHQFDHDLMYSDFLRALRNTGKPPPITDYLDRARPQMKKTFNCESDQKTHDILFPEDQFGQELGWSERPLSVVNNRPVAISHAEKKHSSSGVAQALTATEHLPPAHIEWTPSAGVELVSSADAGAKYIGAGHEEKEFHFKTRKNFPVRDDVAGLLTRPDGDQYHENVCGSRRRRLPDRQSKPPALFGGGSSVMDSLSGYDDKPSDRMDDAAGSHVAGERPVGKKTYSNYSAFGRDGENGHIAVGERVNDFGQMTTQELLWGNMIRRAR
jgi:hypothetical protein